MSSKTNTDAIIALEKIEMQTEHVKKLVTLYKKLLDTQTNENERHYTRGVIDTLELQVDETDRHILKRKED